MKMMLKVLLVLSLLYLANQVQANSNGLARTPPMAWLSWLRFQRETDCKNHPHTCIGEQLYKQHADILVKEGYKDLGYEYVMMDDFWSEKERDKNNRLVPNKNLFPKGMKELADYVHSKGLKLGTYGDVGTQTCGG